MIILNLGYRCVTYLCVPGIRHYYLTIASIQDMSFSPGILVELDHGINLSTKDYRAAPRTRVLI